MQIDPLYPFDASRGTVPSVVPFTIRENPSLLMLVEEMRKWISVELVPFINENIEELAESWAKEVETLTIGWNGTVTGLVEEWTRLSEKLSADLTEYVDDKTAENVLEISEIATGLISQFETVVQQIINSSIEVSDPVISGVVENVDSLTNVSISKIFTPIKNREVNVKDYPYNAKGDGVTDDSEAFKSALMVGDHVHVPPGTYVVSGLSLSTNKILVGAGVGVTVLKHLKSFDCISAKGDEENKVENVGVFDLSISCNGLDKNQRAVFFDSVENSEISGIQIVGAGNNGVNVFNSKSVSVRGTEVSGSGNFGILVYRSAYIDVSENHVHTLNSEGGAHLGIQFKTSKYCTMRDNHVHDISGYGIYTFDDELDPNLYDGNHKIVNNRIENCKSAFFAGIALQVTKSSSNIIDGNIMSNCVGGMSGSNCTNQVITNNSISGVVSAPAISLSISNGTKIIGNVLSGCQQGVVISQSNNVEVTSNKFHNGTASPSNTVAAFKVSGASNGVRIMSNLCIDDREVSNLKRGVFVELGDNCLISENKINGATLAPISYNGNTTATYLNLVDGIQNSLAYGNKDSKMSFYGGAPISRPTVAKDIDSIHAALKSLGLIL